jgi:hypothetical protein
MYKKLFETALTEGIEAATAELAEAWDSIKEFREELQKVKRIFRRSEYNIDFHVPERHRERITGFIEITHIGSGMKFEIRNKSMKTIVTAPPIGRPSKVFGKMHDFRTPLKRTGDTREIDLQKLKRIMDKLTQKFESMRMNIKVKKVRNRDTGRLGYHSRTQDDPDDDEEEEVYTCSSCGVERSVDNDPQCPECYNCPVCAPKDEDYPDEEQCEECLEEEHLEKLKDDVPSLTQSASGDRFIGVMYNIMTPRSSRAGDYADSGFAGYINLDHPDADDIQEHGIDRAWAIVATKAMEDEGAESASGWPCGEDDWFEGKVENYHSPGEVYLSFQPQGFSDRQYKMICLEMGHDTSATRGIPRRPGQSWGHRRRRRTRRRR